MTKANPKLSGFTIVELLVVIVIIGILAAITIVAYTGISQRAVVASIQSDLTSSSQRLKMYYVDHGTYPQTLDGSNCPTGPSDTNYCLKASSGNTYSYSSSSPYSSFVLVATNTNGARYLITNSTATAVLSANWIAGIAATAMAGKYVYNADLGSTYTYEDSYTAVASPQGATGLDPNYPSNMSLVSPQTNSGVDFSAYPAQNACKAISGRLPNTQELLAIYAGRASYGNNFQAAPYWSSTESPSSWAYLVYFNDGNTGSAGKPYSIYVRCVLGG